MQASETPLYPKIFIASSSESKKVAEALRVQLTQEADVTCWYDADVFVNGRTTLQDLIRISKKTDIGIFVFNSDDAISMRGNDYKVTRDNVIFEYGLFASQIGSENTFIIHPKGLPDFHLLTDLAGLTTNPYDPIRDLNQALIGVVSKVKDSIENWRIDKNKTSNEKSSGEIEYFTRFQMEEEPTLTDGNDIGYTRSFNLLLYMFEHEYFKEFRALDFAFSRWEELTLEENEQIENVAKEILHEVNFLYRQGRCRNFRRILVIPENSLKPITFDVLKIIQRSEQEAVNATLNQTKRYKLVPATNDDILETRVLCIGPNQYAKKFESLADFALFTGEVDEFAIVETSLISPSAPSVPYKSRTCEVVTHKGKISYRKEAFDVFWDEAYNITDFIEKYHSVDKSETVLKAFTQFLNITKTKDAINKTSVIIETAYVELMKIGDMRRRFHYERAFELLHSFKTNSFLEDLRDSIYLDAFINDFKPRYSVDYECLEFCDLQGIDDNTKYINLRNEITKELYNRNKSDISNDAITTFYMTKTRNNVTDKLKKIRKDPEKKHLIYEETINESKHLYVKTDIGNIYIGYDKDGSIIPNCALLMAEHYYELFQFAYHKNPHHKDFWIFDFLTLSEKNSVGQGAKVAYILQRWPKNVTVHIVNCSYFDDGQVGDMRYLGPYNF